jgi:hypothetical protein
MPIDQPAEARPDNGADTVSDQVVERPADAMCIQPRSQCMPQSPSGLCDPYCQSGCGCGERCLINSGGTPSCAQPLPGSLAAGQPCVVASSGTTMQTDACAPGLVCVREACGEHCFSYCRSDADCPGSACTRPATGLPGNPGGFKLCEVPFSTCDPTQPQMGCPPGEETCYLSSVADKTFCGCHSGDSRVTDPCNATLDCFPGLICVGAIGDLHCRTVCKLTDVFPCAGAATCHPINDSKIYGYCL